MKSKTKILTALIVLVFLSIIVTNIVNVSSTVFSGTHHMSLPSNLYINKPIILDGKPISVGSFLIKVNDSAFKNVQDLNKYYLSLSPNENIALLIFDINRVKKINDLDSKNKFQFLADTFYIQKSKLNLDFITEISKGLFLGYIVENGATDRAGLKAGDVLLSINDFEMKMDESQPQGTFDKESLKYFRGLPKSEPIDYKILRDNMVIHKTVYLAQFGIPTNFFISLICGLLIFAFGVFLLFKAESSISGNLTTILFVMLGFQISSSFSLSPPDFSLYEWIRSYITNIVGNILSTVAMLSIVYFPYKNKILTEKKIYVTILYIFGIISASLFTYWFIKDYRLIDENILLYLLIASIIYFVVLTSITSRKSKEPGQAVITKVRLFWLILVLLTLTPNIFYLLKFPMTVLEITGYFYLIWVLLPVFYTYIIWKYKLLGIDIKVKMTKQYTFLSVFWKSFTGILFLLTIYFIAKQNIFLPQINFSSSAVEFTTLQPNSPVWEALNKIFFLFIILVTGIVFYKISKLVQGYFDKKFYREKLDYRSAQEELASVLKQKYTLESLAKSIVEKVSSLAKFKSTGVLFFTNKENKSGNIIYCYNTTINDCCDLEISKDVILSLINIREKTTIEELPLKIKNFLQSNTFYNIIPLKTGEKYLGVLFLGEKLSETPLNKDDFEFIDSLVISASIAIENAFLYEEIAGRERIKKELEIAHQIQIASLPQKVPQIKGLDIAAISIPALEVGGDFYDFLNGAIDNLTIVMGDVSGKGTSAALYMSKVQGIFQTLHEFNLSPAKLLTRANRLLYKHIDSKSYITAVGAYFDTTQKNVCYARAGHLPLYHYSNVLNEIRKLRPSGIGLGLSDETIFDSSIEEVTIKFSVGDVFVFLSDGVTEALSKSGEQYGEEKILETILLSNTKSSKELLTEFTNSVSSFSLGTNQFDDITLVVVKIVE